MKDSNIKLETIHIGGDLVTPECFTNKLYNEFQPKNYSWSDRQTYSQIGHSKSAGLDFIFAKKNS